MNDFRTHSGIDITGDIGSPVCAFASGVVAEIRNDAFLGVTVVLEHSGGMVSSYSNLAENLPQEISVGAFVEVGQTIGGIGETAIIESADVPHVHFELYLNETCVNPEDYLS
jgi:murein DD-endopeptidase MepM/ murein hydrolase activator NlpD